MRAKTINEVQNFERGIHPRSAMNLGGIQFGVEKYKMKEKLKEDWKNFVQKTLKGKTISGLFNKWGYNKETNMPESIGWGNYTVKVKEVSNDGIDENGIIVSDGKNSYIIPIGEERIFIER